MVVLALALALALPHQHAARATASLPAHGVLVPGKTLAGVALGDSVGAVERSWGRAYRVCKSCNARGSGRETRLYTYEAYAQALGAAVTFNRVGKVVAVFTLGSPMGWRTREGLRVGEHVERIRDLYGSLPWRVCIGYGAISMRRPGTVTSIYTTGESVYGFALTAPTEPVCQ